MIHPVYGKDKAVGWGKEMFLGSRIIVQIHGETNQRWTDNADFLISFLVPELGLTVMFL